MSRKFVLAVVGLSVLSVIPYLIKWVKWGYREYLEVWYEATSHRREDSILHAALGRKLRKFPEQEKPKKEGSRS